MLKIIKYVVGDILRNRIMVVYTIFLLAISLSFFNLEDNISKGLLSLLNIVLIIIPLVSIIFSTIYIYNSAEFIELLVSQPLKRKNIWISIFAGMAISLTVAFMIGAGIPILFYAPSSTGIAMLVMGILLSIIFASIAMLTSVMIRDKAKGIGISILLWLYFSLLFDGIILFLLFQFEDYPLEKPMIAMTALNPIDLGRILILLKMDISALMGYTGAVFRDFFGTQAGFMMSLLIMFVWILIPAALSVRKFNRKDL